ncbi:MAG: hypothetical protein JXR94_19060, partial [Candidatus Hydrogenedentes bacterium]|nr:hypothetical protein [Candidatus Hydrogenedentota bacterium]
TILGHAQVNCTTYRLSDWKKYLDAATGRLSGTVQARVPSDVKGDTRQNRAVGAFNITASAMIEDTGTETGDWEAWR